jgi:uncharacterized protein
VIPSGMRSLLLFVLIGVSLTACRSDEPKRQKRAERYDGPVIDVHAHADDQEAFLKNAANPRLTRVVAMTTAVLAGNIAATKSQNDALLALKEKSAKVVPCPSVHPHDGAAALDEVNRMADAGAKILALHLERQKIELSDGSVLEVVRRAGERGMAVIIEAAPGEPGLFKKVLDLANKAPNTKIILAHMGLTDFPDAALLAHVRQTGQGDNLYFDVSATSTLYKSSPYVEQLLWVIRLFPDRVFFGSDFPRWTSADATDATERLGLSAGEMSMVFYANAAKMFGL